MGVCVGGGGGGGFPWVFPLFMCYFTFPGYFPGGETNYSIRMHQSLLLFFRGRESPGEKPYTIATMVKLLCLQYGYSMSGCQFFVV